MENIQPERENIEVRTLAFFLAVTLGSGGPRQSDASVAAVRQGRAPGISAIAL
jgi:hypothetical protein